MSWPTYDLKRDDLTALGRFTFGKLFPSQPNGIMMSLNFELQNILLLEYLLSAIILRTDPFLNGKNVSLAKRRLTG